MTFRIVRSQADYFLEGDLSFGELVVQSQLDAKHLTLTQLFKVFLTEYPLLVVDALPLLLGK